MVLCVAAFVVLLISRIKRFKVFFGHWLHVVGLLIMDFIFDADSSKEVMSGVPTFDQIME